MKNYLVGAVRPVSTAWGGWKSQIEENQALQEHKKYQEMYNISRASARKFLSGTWEEIKFVAPVLDARLYQIAQWYAIKELWFREPCNILFMGADTLFMKPTEIFDKYDTMRMFNYTDPKTHPEFPHYFNDDIRYYPANMDPKVWNIGERCMNQWFTHKESDWGWGQLIHNYQLWSQGLTVEEIIDPTLAYQGFMYPDYSKETGDAYNNCRLEDAKIIHWHGSRGAARTVEMMQAVSNQLQISVESI